MSKYDKIDKGGELKKEFMGKVNSVKDIQSILEDIEMMQGVDVLYSSLIGSRTYGYANKFSDYNVRFVYRKPLEDYLVVCPQADTIKFKQHNYEIIGWDIRRVLHQHFLSNPLLYDWFKSPTTYWEDLIDLNELMPFDKNALLKWFYLIAQHNYNKAQNDIPYKLKFKNIKEYLYAIRYILMWNVVYYYDDYPPISMKKLLVLNKKIGVGFTEFIEGFVEYYKSTGQKEFGYHELSHINSWIKNSLMIMGNSYPLRPPKRKDCYYYDKRFLELVSSTSSSKSSIQ